MRTHVAEYRSYVVVGPMGADIGQPLRKEKSNRWVAQPIFFRSGSVRPPVKYVLRDFAGIGSAPRTRICPRFEMASLIENLNSLLYTHGK